MTDQKWIDMCKDAFRFSFDEQSTDLDRLKSKQKTYDNTPDKSIWPTRSKIPIPLAWSDVETALGPAMDAMFPPGAMPRLISETPIDPDVLDRSQWALYCMLEYRMRIKRQCLRAVKDCFKLDVGYMIVEPITVTPPAVFDIAAGGSREKLMGKGRPVRSLRGRYVSTGKILPYPAGVDFNGEDPTPYSWFLDPVPETLFRKMFEDAAHAGLDKELRGNPDEMIAQCKSLGFNSQTDFVDFADKLSGRSTQLRAKGKNYANAPIMVPLLKFYGIHEGRWSWIFPGSTWEIVWDKYDSYDTARCPLIKFDAWTDCDRWYPMGMAEASERVIWEKNILVNAMNDLVQLSLKRPLLYDNRELPDGPPKFGPDNSLGIPGNVSQTARFMDPPGIDVGTFQMHEMIDNIRLGITGNQDMTAKNFTRGGSMAFQDLLQSSTGRQRLRHALLQTGGFESLVQQVLIYMQTLGGGMNLTFQRPAYDQTNAKEFMEYFSVTEDDLKHAFTVALDLDEKAREGSMDAQMRLQRYDKKMASPYWDKWAVQEDIEPDPNRRMRQLLPRDVVRKKQAEQEAAQLEAMRAKGAPQAPGGMADSVMDGGMMGGTPNPMEAVTA